MSHLRLIFSGDDYGRALSINAGIIRAHEQGVLTSASLMVTGEAVGDAVRQAHEHPTLAVGLHLVLTGAQSVLPAKEVPHLVDARGHLPGDPFLAGVRFFLSRQLRNELRREIAAQLERFLATGLPLAHVDGHYFLHLHPVVFSVLLPLVEEYGVPGIRLAPDDLRLTLALDRAHLAGKVTWASLYGLLLRMTKGRLRRGRPAYTDRVFGLLQTGHMHERFVVGLLRSMPAQVRSAELYFHPSTLPMGRPYGPNPGDLATLLSPHVRAAIQERGAELTSYAGLRAQLATP